MSKRKDTGRNPTDREWNEAQRIASYPGIQQGRHPSAVPADRSKLGHVHTWYYEEAKAHIDARAVECHDCRKAKKQPR